MGVALVALAFAVSGTSFAHGAATKIGKLVSGAKIKRSSIPGNRLIKGGVSGDRLRSNSVTGKQVDESTLATVPSALTAKHVAIADRATNAQRATNADNALSLGGTAAAAYVSFATRAIPAGTTVTGAFGIAESAGPAGAAGSNDIQQVVQLPGSAPSDLTSETVNFANAAGAIDADGTCTGSPSAPTAPAGKVCLYLSAAVGDGTLFEGAAIPGLAGSRSGFVVHALNTALSATGVFGTWAYTAP